MKPRVLSTQQNALVLSIVLLLGAAAPIASAPPAPIGIGSTQIFAAGGDGFSISRFMSGLDRRDRIVQVCAVVMCLALFIICKKFSAQS